MGIVVLGMHRSGTSVLSRFLGLLVGYQGHPGVAEDNQEGHWESPRMNYELEVALRGNDADWASPPLVTMKLPLSGPGSLPSLETIALGLGSQEWVLKDPRFCLCVDAIHSICKGATFVATYRPPIEVAKSIESRDGYPFEYGLALWEVYNRHLLMATRDLERVIWLPYHELMSGPAKSSARMGSRLRELGHHVDKAAEFSAAAAINPSLRHQQGSGLDTRMSEEQLLLMDALEVAASGRGAVPELGEVTFWSRALLDTRRPYARMERDNRLLRKRIRPLAPSYRALDYARRRLNLARPEDPFA